VGSRAARIGFCLSLAIPVCRLSASDDLAITIRNASPLEICEVAIFAPGADPVENRLDDDERIAPGASRRFAVGPGPWNVLTADCDDGTPVGLDFRRPAGEMTVGGAGTVALKIQNAREERVCEVREGEDNLLPHWAHPANPSYRELWPIDPGETQWVLLPPGVHFLEARSCGGESIQEAEVEVPHQATWKLEPHPPAGCTVRAGAPRVTGLERLYFRKIEGPMADDASVTTAIDPAALRRLLPEKLPTGRRYWESGTATDTDRELRVQDHLLPTAAGEPEWLLREVQDTSVRMPQQWWVFYEDGCRTDGWYFTPARDLTEGKLLTDVRLVRIERPAPARMTLSVAGRMDRPAGAWWEMSADLLFGVSSEGIRLERVANRTYVYSDYDRGEGSVSMSALVERDVVHDGRPMVEVRGKGGIDERTRVRCALDPEVTEVGLDGAVSPECVTAGAGATVKYRAQDAPSYMERGGR
jgi:hypothetical protein